MYDCSKEQAQEAPSHEHAVRALQRNALKPPPENNLDALVEWVWDWHYTRDRGLPVYEEEHNS